MSENTPEVTEEEMTSASKDMKNNKATGVDELVIEAINEGGPKIITALKHLFK